MTEHSWNRCWVIAWILWSVSGLLMVGSLAVWDDILADHLGRLGIFGAMVSCITTGRAIQTRNIRLMREAFAAGRDYEGSRELHSV